MLKSSHISGHSPHTHKRIHRRCMPAAVVWQEGACSKGVLGWFIAQGIFCCGISVGLVCFCNVSFRKACSWLCGTRACPESCLAASASDVPKLNSRSFCSSGQSLAWSKAREATLADALSAFCASTVPDVMFDSPTPAQQCTALSVATHTCNSDVPPDRRQRRGGCCRYMAADTCPGLAHAAVP